MHPCSSESYKWCVGWDQLFSPDSHLLECWIVQDIDRAPEVHKDLVGVVIPYTYADYKCIVVWVMETSGIFLHEPNYGVVESCHLWYVPHQLDILNHP